ncbi:hypothetical protein LSPH24S_07704 [Lysinibacillus sphaericus]
MPSRRWSRMKMAQPIHRIHSVQSLHRTRPHRAARDGESGAEPRARRDRLGARLSRCSGTSFRERVHTVSGGEVAGILVAVFWAIRVSFLAVALARLAQTLRTTTKLVADVTDQAFPLLAVPPPLRCAARRPRSTGSTRSPPTSRRSPRTPPRCPPPWPPPSVARWSRSRRSGTACAGHSAVARRTCPPRPPRRGVP